MVAFPFRMGAGFPGDVNRTHPVSIEPGLIDASAPPQNYGVPVILDATTQGFRPFTTGDTAVTTAYGITVRPFPTQQSTGGAQSLIGGATPPQSGIQDVMRLGYIMVQIPAGQSVKKGGAVFVWCAASSGAHVQGNFEGASSGGNTASLGALFQFNGPADANGVTEVIMSPQ